MQLGAFLELLRTTCGKLWILECVTEMNLAYLNM